MHLGFTILLSLFIATVSGQWDQISSPNDIYEPIINLVEVLESNQDAKCQATAFRFEDFLYGVPLSPDARIHRIELQKSITYALWRSLTIQYKNQVDEAIDINPIADRFISVEVTNGNLFLITSLGDRIEISERDLRQYSSIAYNLRAILAIQQEHINDQEPLLTLNERQLAKLKQVLDITMLGILKVATEKAKTENEEYISPKHLSFGYKQIIKAQNDSNLSKRRNIPNPSVSLTQKIVDQKIRAYEKYNNINQSVFLRNIQVYFAQVEFPTDSLASRNLATLFQNSCITFGTQLLKQSTRATLDSNNTILSYKDVSSASQKLLPFSINQFEDVTFFPNYNQEQQLTIESYDLDAFRDSGLHWRIIKFMTADNLLDDRHLDPFALEHVAESIAQYGVLLWRLAGKVAKKNDDAVLTVAHLINAQNTLIELSTQHPSTPLQQNNIDYIEIQSSKSANNNTTVQFENVSAKAGINHYHKSADWLSRLIRSYVIDSPNKIAKLSIPPAFGGAGIAAADINNDGYDDLLLLSGLGNQLLLNNKDKTYTDITIQSGVQLIRSDGNHAEPRQPIIVDFNNDGYQDILITYVDDNHQLLQGAGDGTFMNKTNVAQLGGKHRVGGPATVADFNNDGLLDIYIGYFGNYLNGQLPTLARHNTNGGINQLFINKGQFQFENVTLTSGVGNIGWTQAVGHTDINADGRQDIIVGNDFGINAYYINTGDTFIDSSKFFGTDKPSYTMNIGIGDLNQDLLPDFYISNIVVMEKDDKYVLPNKDQQMHFDLSSLSSMRVVEANDLFLSSSSNHLNSYTNSNQVLSGNHLTGWSWDADFWDYDNDGDDDLYCLTGMNPYSVYGVDNPYYQDPSAASKEVLFAKSNESPNVLFTNQNGSLIASDNSSGLAVNHTSRSATYTDYDRDGDLDVVLGNYHGATMLFENKNKTNNHWLQVKLQDLTNGNNRDAIGAKLIITLDNDQTIWREVHSTDGYLSVHPKTMSLGLGSNKIRSLKIIWPDGFSSIHRDISPNQHLSIVRKGTELTLNATFE